MSDPNQNGQNSNGNGHKPPKKSSVPDGKDMRLRKAAKAFVENGGNRTKAYIAAGYSPNGAGPNSARLTKDEQFAAHVKEEMARAAACAGISQESVMGQLVRLGFYDAKDLCNTQGHFDFKKARRKGLTYLIEQIEVTERTSKDGSKRMTTKYRLPHKQPAIDALMRAMGMEKELAKNPKDAAAKALEQLRVDFPDLAPGKHEQIIAQTYGVPIKDLGTVG